MKETNDVRIIIERHKSTNASTELISLNISRDFIKVRSKSDLFPLIKLFLDNTFLNVVPLISNAI